MLLFVTSSCSCREKESQNYTMVFATKILVFLFVFEISAAYGDTNTYSENVDSTSFIYAVVSGIVELFNSTQSVSLAGFSASGSNVTYNFTFQDARLFLPSYMTSPSYEVTGNSTSGYNVSTLLYVPDVQINSSSTIHTENGTYSGPISLNVQDVDMDAFFEISNRSANFSLVALEVSARDIVGALDFSIDYGANVSTSVIEDISDQLVDYTNNNVTSFVASLVQVNLEDTLQRIKLEDYIILSNTTTY